MGRHRGIRPSEWGLPPGEMLEITARMNACRQHEVAQAWEALDDSKRVLVEAEAQLQISQDRCRRLVAEATELRANNDSRAAGLRYVLKHIGEGASF
jgi:hypothetical protein